MRPLIFQGAQLLAFDHSHSGPVAGGTTVHCRDKSDAATEGDALPSAHLSRFQVIRAQFLLGSTPCFMLILA